MSAAVGGVVKYMVENNPTPTKKEDVDTEAVNRSGNANGMYRNILTSPDGDTTTPKIKRKTLLGE